MNLANIKSNFGKYKNVVIKYATNFMDNIENPTIEQLEHAVDIGVPFAFLFTNKEEIYMYYDGDYSKSTSYHKDVDHFYTCKNGIFIECMNASSSSRVTNLSHAEYKLLKDHGKISIADMRSLIEKEACEISWMDMHTYLYKYLDDEYDNAHFSDFSDYFEDVSNFDFFIEHKISFILELNYMYHSASFLNEYYIVRYDENGVININVTDIKNCGSKHLSTFEDEQFKLMKLMDAL